jgi:hypothetical protein
VRLALTVSSQFIIALMGVKFRISNRFGDRHVAHGEPLKLGFGLVWPADRAQRRFLL